MKTTQAVRDIRKAGTKRVKSIVDDYGNRVHVLKTKSGGTRIKNSGATGSRHSLSQGKKMAKNILPKYPATDGKLNLARHGTSAGRRAELTHTTNKKNLRNTRKLKYHQAGTYQDPTNKTKYAKAINRKKAKNFGIGPSN